MDVVFEAKGSSLDGSEALDSIPNIDAFPVQTGNPFVMVTYLHKITHTPQTDLTLDTSIVDELNVENSEEFNGRSPRIPDVL